MKKITQQNYRTDKMFPAIQKAVHDILQSSFVVAPVDVLQRTSRITKKQIEDWRFGRIDYLERIISGKLSQLSRFLRILEKHCLSMGLKPSQTVYTCHGKKGTRPKLRFTKSEDRNLELAYSRHYISTYRKPAPAIELSSETEPPTPVPSATKTKEE